MFGLGRGAGGFLNNDQGAGVGQLDLGGFYGVDLDEALVDASVAELAGLAGKRGVVDAAKPSAYSKALG